MPNACNVPGCRGNYKDGPKVSAFKFPGNKELQQKWIHAIHRKDFSVTKDSRESSPKKPKPPYPKAVFFIIGNEFCERFNYYGLRTILTLFLSQRLYYSEDTTTMYFHLFSMLAYFTPVLGAIIADSWLGKFNTILYVSILYVIGCIILSVGAFPQELYTMKAISLLGLLIIGFGTGGIKPCVSAFGGDQFKENQERELQQFFSLFYLSINLGSVVATIVTPMLREDVHCLGERTCYPLAFGVPSILMVIALLLFVCGKPFYKIRPAEGNVMLEVAKCVCYAIGKKFKSSVKKKHWLDYAEDKFEKNLIRDIKILSHVLVLYIPLPVFWALFDQQASRWTLQATRMDGKLNGFFLKPDQMQVANSFLIIVFIPVFEYVVYPLLDKCHILKKPLQRITTGGILAAISFAVAGFIELSLEKYYPVMPSPGYTELTIINNVPCSINIQGTNLTTINAFETSVKELTLHEKFTWSFTAENCTMPAAAYNLTFNASTPIQSMMITLHNGNLIAQVGNDTKTKSKDGEPQVRLFYNIEKMENENITFLFQRENGDKHYIDTGDTEIYGMSEYGKIPPGEYLIYASYNKTNFLDEPIAEELFKSGGIYIITVYNKTAENNQFSSKHQMVIGNEIHLLLQIPQYVIITAGEIMFSITGIEFSYSQAPYSMKSVIQSGWLLTTAFGNLIVLVIAHLKLFEKQSHELFFFGGLMAVDMLIFAILAYFYKYVKIKSPSEEKADQEARETRERSNEASEEETDVNK